MSTTRDQGNRCFGLVTRKKHRMKSNGSRTKTQPGTGYFRECPFCPWVWSAIRKQNEPVRLPAGAKRCPNGHLVS